MTNWKVFGAAIVTAVLMSAPNASATILTATNGNSSIEVNSGSQAGMDSWVVDGVQQMFQQWFWFRVGSTGPEAAINTLTQTGATAAGRVIDVTYCSNGSANCGTGWSVDVLYTLTGGLANSHTSDVAETITINNQTGAALDLHFFQYADFDLNGTAGGQTVTFVNANTVRQTGSGAILSETIVTPAASHHEAGLFANTLNSLNDGAATTLNDSNSAGPGDATWAFQWDKSIANNGSFIISKDKNLAAAVPEPASILLFGTMLLGCAGVLRRRLV